jgi:signal transduction histidine kinase
VRRLAVVHADPAKEHLASELQRRYPPLPGSDRGIATVIAGRRPRLVPEITNRQLAGYARDPEHLAILRGLGLRSAMMVPLIARNRTLGVITLVSAESGHRYSPSDLAVAEDLGRRAATAVDNARLYREAQEALRLREEFLSIASHELKTPLTALHLQVQVLKRAIATVPWETPGVERLLETLEAAQRQVKRLTKLINDLLDVSRIAGGRLELERSEVDLWTVVRDAAARFEEEVRSAGSELTVESDAPVLGIWDRFRLDQVVTNLLSNAIKYGEGRPIEVRVCSDGATARLTVRDRGTGIAPEHLPRIFDRFERAASSGQPSGLGLGLYICRQLVEAHEGTIRVTSCPGVGSTFEVELPLAPSP